MGRKGLSSFAPRSVPGAPRGAGAGLRTLLACAAMVAGSCPVWISPASAQDAKTEAPVDLKRLQFEFKCFFKTPGWEGKGEVQFLDRLRAQRVAYVASATAQVPAFDDLFAEALWLRAEYFQSRNDLDKASGFAAELRKLDPKSKKVAEYLPAAQRLVDGYSFNRAKDLEEKEKNPAKAKVLYLQCVDSTDAAIQKGSVDAVIRITKDASGLAAAEASGDPNAEADALMLVLDDLTGKDGKGGVLDASVLAKGSSELDRMRSRMDKLYNSIGTLDISFKDVSGDLRTYKGATTPIDLKSAQFLLTPISGGEIYPKNGKRGTSPKDKIVLVQGIYRIEVWAPGNDRPVAVWASFQVAKGKFPLGIPSTIPEGMVYVGPWEGGGGFFIDLTEVTVGQVEAMRGDDSKLAEVIRDTGAGNPSAPAWFWPGAVDAWVRASGKQIPTTEEWLQAAYGPFAPAERPYPWGKDAPKADVHFFADANAGEPRPVGTYPAGASPYGCLDMVGNLGEYVRGKDGLLWNLGGYYQLGADKMVASGGMSWIRVPAPGDDAVKAMDSTAQKTYLDHMVKDSFTYCTGLRMVIRVR